MLLAEALGERADAQRRLAALKRRIGDNALVQEGEVPAENPRVLLDEAEGLVERIREIVVAVNTANTATALTDGTSVTEAIARRDALGTRIRLLVDAAGEATTRSRRRYGLREIRDVAMLDVAALRATADQLTNERRRLDVQLQQANWTTEL